MDRERADVTLDDKTLEREIEDALAVDPSPEFLARVRTRLASEPAPSLWRLSWRFAGVATLAAAVVLALVVTRSERAPLSEMPVTSIDASPVPGSLAAGPANAVTPPPSAPAPVVVTSSGRVPYERVTRSTTEVEVLISPRDAAALRVLMANVRDGRVGATAIQALQADATPLEPLDTIAIQPIAIEPLPQLALLEGEHR